ncbi:MAG: glutamine synthetase III [Proteocatella sp.]
MDNISDNFSSMVFNNNEMRKKLPKAVYKEFLKTIENNKPLDIDLANHMATAMKEWAIEKGATHFNHWFQPLTGITAGKHESFINIGDNDEVLLEFSGKELVKGEPDASSFPSGGLRATFEARGYTSWDPTSPAFVKDDTLYIPTAFCSYSGEVLDKKTPLLKSLNALNTQALRVLKQLGYDDVKKISVTVGGEQEYFLIDKKLYEKRKDLIFCGRTLFGAKAPKGQELEDHYFGSIKPRVNEFMKELDLELWKLGIPSKTKHNEVAPAQHELAPIFTNANIAIDHNQIIMELMKKIADKHNLACLLHEKPFAGLNGSGKHNNWSLSTDTGINIFDSGSEPEKNILFLVFLVALIQAVDEYADLIRVSVSSAGNDHRLGGNEAPPAIVSMFLGDELSSIIDSIKNGSSYQKIESCYMKSGLNMLHDFKKDTSDRNRTAPIAFTGNKFEFRMPGSSMSLSGINIVINTAMANSLSSFADEIEALKCEKEYEFEEQLFQIIKDKLNKHSRVIFDGNCYSKEWAEEAKNRGLYNIALSSEAFPMFKSEKNIALFEKHSIFTKEEIESRFEVMSEGYSKVINIEALTMIEMVNKDILPAIILYMNELSKTISTLKTLNLSFDSKEFEPRNFSETIFLKLSKLSSILYEKSEELSNMLILSKNFNTEDSLKYLSSDVIQKMNEIRTISDEIEAYIPRNMMPYPSYSELLFSV